MGLLFHAADDRQGFAEVALGVPRGMGQRHEHLPGLAAALPYVVLDDGVLAVKPVLIPQPIEDAFVRVALLPRHTLVIFQYSVDNAPKWLQLGAPGQSLSPVARRDGVGQHLPYSVAAQPCGPADTIPLGTSLSPSIGSFSTLWMATGGTVFNRQMSAIYPPAWSNLTPPFTL